jgi:hypothetical protein
MKRNQHPYTILQMASAVLMMLALLWLTVSMPFVFANYQELQKQDKIANNISPLAGSEEEAATPFGNTTEEKAPGGNNSFSEEYLHDNHKAEYFFSITSQYHKGENAGTYIAFHGELLVPPPNVT